MVTKNKEKVKISKLVLLDAHAILHRAYHALPEFSSSKGEPTGALYGFSAMIIKIISDLKPDYIIACYDLPEPTYRHEVYEDYKAGRAKADDDLVSQIKNSYNICSAFSIPVYSSPGFEADDILGTIVEKLSAKNSRTDIIIASGDMDTLQLVSDEKVQVYTLRKGINDTVIYNEKKVMERFGFGPKLLPDYKGLRGDPSDNIIGIKGIGEKTATELIKNFGSLENMYKILKKNPKPFSDKGVKERIIGLLKENEEEAEFSKMLALIRRDAPIDFSLPEKNWREEVSIEKIKDLFRNFEFKTLGNRIESVLLKKEHLTNEKKSENKSVGGARQQSFNEAVNKDVSDQEISEMSIALWMVDSNITNPSYDDILRFAKTKSWEKAKDIILKELDKRKVRAVFEKIEKPIIPVVKGMKERGVRIDKKILKDLSKHYKSEILSLEKKIWKQAGQKFNINSPKQLSNILFDVLGLSIKNQKKTSTGAKSTRESELVKLSNEHPIIPLVLEHREIQKLLSTYIEAIQSHTGSDGRLRATFLQAGTTTGRMASVNPNLQNIPIKTERGRLIRKAFRAEENFVLASFDYSQIELRIAAFLSGDKKLIEIFKNNQDVHTAVASEVFNVSPEEVNSEMRRRAKVINFGILYGMGVNALRANLGTSRKEAQEFYNQYFKKFSGLSGYIEKIKKDAGYKGYTETYFGRRRYFQGIKSGIPYIRAAAERMAVNAPVQGTSADIIKIAMKRIDDFIKEDNLQDKIYLILQVHDELVYEIKENVVEMALSKIKEIMENVILPKEIYGIKLKVGASVGKNFGQMREVASSDFAR